jgi:hypothetical protein
VDDGPEPTEAEQESFIAELQENGRRCAERVERSWWREPLKAALTEHKLTGDRTQVDALERRLLADLERRYPESEQRAREARISGKGDLEEPK